MQEELILENFEILLEDFKKTTKRVLQSRPLSKNKVKINEYIKLICVSYNKLVEFIEENRSHTTAASFSKFIKQIEGCKIKLNSCGLKLNYCFDFPDSQVFLPYPVFDDGDEFVDANTEPSFKLTHTASLPDNLHCLHVNVDSVKAISYPDFNKNIEGIDCEAVKADLNSNSADISIFDSVNQVLESISKNSVKAENNTNNILIANNNLHHMMASAADKRTFIGMCASIIRNNYDGDPLELESFIDKIVLIEELTEEVMLPTLIRFVVSKLSGEARESIPTNVDSIEALKVSLRERIKPDNSKVVAGKIASIQVVNNNYADFSKNVEELADALERSLVVEGITKTKAHEMAVEQTVQTCRANAKSDLIKSILASSKFNDPKDVVAKLIIEQSNETQEKQVLRFNNFGRQNPNNNRRDFQFDNQYNNRNSRYRNNDRFNYNNRNNNSNNNHNNNNNNRYNFNNNTQNRSNSRTFNNSHYNNRNYNSRGNYQNSRSNNYTSSQQQQQRNFDNNTVVVRNLNSESHQEVVQEPLQN